MKQPYPFRGVLLAAGLMLVTGTGCTVKATLKTTTDGTVNFLSSTSGKSWIGEDGLLAQDEKVQAFVAMNFEAVKQSLARGEGEYVTALASLLGVPLEQHVAFAVLTRARYDALVPSEHTTPQELVAALSRELPPGWTGSSGG